MRLHQHNGRHYSINQVFFQFPFWHPPHISVGQEAQESGKVIYLHGEVHDLCIWESLSNDADHPTRSIQQWASAVPWLNGDAYLKHSRIIIWAKGA